MAAARRGGGGTRMEAPLPQPQLGPTLSQQEDQEEEATSFFLASLAAATSTMTTTTSSNRSNMKASLSLLPASPDFMAFQGFVSLGPHQLPLAFSCETPGGRVLLSSLRGDARLRALWEQEGWLSRARLERCHDVASFSAELEDMLSSPLPPFHPPAVPCTLPTLGQADGRETKRRRRRGKSTTAPPSQYRQLLRELDALGWECIQDLSPSSSSQGQGRREGEWMTLTLSVLDRGGRKHEMAVDLPPHPSFFSSSSTSSSSLPRCRVALPPMGKKGGGREGGEMSGFLELKPPSSSSPSSSSLFHLQAAKRQFEECLDACQDFWEVMDDIDTHTWVMGGESERFRRQSTKRRLVLHAHASCVITIDASAPYNVSDVQFIGPEATVRPWSERMYTRVGDWDTSKKPRENLEAILGLSFPVPPTATAAAGDAAAGKEGGREGGKEEGWQQEYVEECCICYAYRLEGEEGKEGGGDTPTLTCENEHCRRLFHPLCLRQWLQTLPDTKILGGRLAASHTLVGACPFCCDPISFEASSSSMA